MQVGQAVGDDPVVLTAAIDDGRISQVIELACGLSPRG